MRCVLIFLCFVSTFLHAEESYVLMWNQTATRASQEMQETIPLAARSLAILQTAVYDTVQAIEKQRRLIYVNQELLQEIEGPISRDAAITAAAHAVLTRLYPSLAHEFDADLLRIYAKIPNNSAKEQGILTGREVAAQVLAWRAHDLDGVSPPLKSLEPRVGFWTPEAGVTPLTPYWATQAFFVIENVQDFPVPAPLALTETRYSQEYYHTKRLGRSTSHERTKDHTAQGMFWVGNPIIYWNGVARLAIEEKKLTEQQAAHLLALLNVTLADTTMATWASKYHYMTWRPQEAIQRAKEMTDAALLADKDWKPLLTNPPYPQYPSAHSACSGAASVILKGYVGDPCSFTCTNCGEPPSSDELAQQLVKTEKSTVRQFNAFSSAAKEAADARVYAGVCFPDSTHAGAELGKRIAYHVLENSTQKVKKPL